MDLPTYSARRDIAKIHISKTKRNVELYDLSAIAEASAGHSGAEIEQAVFSAMYTAFAEHREYTTADIVNALRSTQPLSVTMADQFEAQRAYSKDRARPASKPDITETVAASRYTD